VENPLDWEHPHFDQLRQTPERYEEGTPGLLATACLLASVRLLESVGFDTVHSRVTHLARFAHERLQRAGMNVITSPDETKRSGIIGFRHPRLPNEEVLKALEVEKVRAVARCGNLRFAPHAYSTEAETERAVEAIRV
jgi:selenocysteine lyase/cysteine desulfurase